jgi:UDP-glucose:(heptosyl)LPS alpha-1,3-glucosyltransferase
MRIALFIERFEPGRGGVENVAWTVAHHLARAGDDVHVIARRASSESQVQVHEVDVSDRWQPMRVANFSRAAARVAPRGSFDIVYSLARTACQDVYRAGGGSHANYMERRYRTRLGSLYRASPRHAVLLSIERRVFRDASQTIQCGSEMVRRELQQRYQISSERLVVVRNAVDLNRFRQTHDQRHAHRVRLRTEFGAGERPVWLFAGSGFARKGLDTALQALARAGCPDSQMWIVGGDRPTAWERLAKSLGVDERVRFLGFRSDMPALYAAADALVLPTRYDACANVCLEAAAAGIPIVTTTSDGAAEVLGAGGFIIDDPEDADAVAAALDTLADPDTRTRMGAAAHAAAARLSWSDHVTRLRTLFAERAI